MLPDDQDARTWNLGFTRCVMDHLQKNPELGVGPVFHVDLVAIVERLIRAHFPDMPPSVLAEVIGGLRELSESSRDDEMLMQVHNLEATEVQSDDWRTTALSFASTSDLSCPLLYTIRHPWSYNRHVHGEVVDAQTSTMSNIVSLYGIDAGFVLASDNRQIPADFPISSHFRRVPTMPLSLLDFARLLAGLLVATEYRVCSGYLNPLLSRLCGEDGGAYVDLYGFGHYWQGEFGHGGFPWTNVAWYYRETAYVTPCPFEGHSRGWPVIVFPTGRVCWCVVLSACFSFLEGVSRRAKRRAQRGTLHRDAHTGALTYPARIPEASKKGAT